ncbi:11699_t:CDS:2 [Entrophospora sp. SA101]|nr:11699_t:CDS:2 [Entrophospora sp. SA101]
MNLSKTENAIWSTNNNCRVGKVSSTYYVAKALMAEIGTEFMKQALVQTMNVLKNLLIQQTKLFSAY